MKSIKRLTSTCRYCRHYQPEGRRGGMCEKLSAPVQGVWKACPFALPAFAPSWETLEDAWSLPVARPVLSASQTLPSELDNLTVASVEDIPTSAAQEVENQRALIYKKFQQSTVSNQQ
ncbi:hypothetical protein FJR38_20100 [Anabaena sp. UHCC 0253]|uniref:hypothetical protein n=1 Tax=Anabaena sp. UHCC 0253 TaxID=2590019 RepID=UPI001445A925|nr:hypothetical protein [Anabaena sp. UHCC 0253]MTJ54801.1 hypothetical protein [Anabaena sp. UHCC 0253]